MSDQYLLEMQDISKEYSGNRVLNHVSIRVKPGEIVALIGENGAGKSTIMNILFGMPGIHQTGGFSGKIRMNGKDVSIGSPMEAMNLGIGMVHQEFMLIDGYDVAENIKLNRENIKPTILSKLFGKRLNRIDREAMHADARTVLGSLDFGIDENAIVKNLSVGYKQFIEIARELDKSNARLIVLDEPTAVLTEIEAEKFIDCVQQVAQKGVSFIFISHKLNEIKKIADHIFVLRDGEIVGDYDNQDLSVVRMSELMVGRTVELRENVAGSEKDDAPVCLEIKDFYVSMPGENCLGINLQVKKGEIFGIAGLAGHGKLSIANGVMGLYPSKGEVLIHGEKITPKDTRETLRKGVAFVSENRRDVGLVLDESIELNICTAAMQIQKKFTKKSLGIEFYDQKQARAYAEKVIQELDIRCKNSRQKVKRLSGGNQQKVCIARALALEPDILFVSEPTRGIDIGAKKLILDTLYQLNREKGTTIIITSSELAELRSTCDRIAIIAEGKVIGTLRPQDPDYQYGLLMSGIQEKKVGKAI